MRKPTYTKPTYTVRQVLAQVNRIRKRLGKPTLAEMPRGVRWDGRACPVKNALDARAVCRAFAATPSGRVQFPKGGIVSTFIRDFDMGAYPELEC